MLKKEFVPMAIQLLVLPYVYVTEQKNCVFYLNLNISRGGPMKIWSGSLIVWVDSTFYDSATQTGDFF